MASSLLDRLKARRAEIAADVVFTVKLPRWSDPSIAVRLKAPDSDHLDRILKRHDKAKTGSAKFDISARFLADHVTALYVIDDATDDATETSFVELADALDIPASPAEALKALFFTEPDLGTTLTAYAEWAGQEGERIDGNLVGESGN